MDLLKWAIILALVAIAAGWLGFGGVARGASTLAKILFGIFLVIALIIILLVLGVGSMIF